MHTVDCQQFSVRARTLASGSPTAKHCRSGREWPDGAAQGICSSRRVKMAASGGPPFKLDMPTLHSQPDCRKTPIRNEPTSSGEAVLCHHAHLLRQCWYGPFLDSISNDWL